MNIKIVIYLSRQSKIVERGENVLFSETGFKCKEEECLLQQYSYFCKSLFRNQSVKFQEAEKVVRHAQTGYKLSQINI